MKWIVFLGSSMLGLVSVAEEARAKSCNNDSNSDPTIACYQPVTWTLWSQTVEIESGASYEIFTTDLSLLPYESNTPDTVLWLLNPTTNDVVASNDDTIGVASKLTFTATSSFTGLIVVTGYGDAGHGTCDVVVRKNTSQIANYQDQPYGGFWIPNHEIEEDDLLFVGVANNGWPNEVTFTANRMFVFESSSVSCSYGSSCGSFVEAPPWVAGLSVVQTPFASSAALIAVGSFYANRSVPARFFHSRLGEDWGEDQAYEDNDGDGLTWEIEELSHATDPLLDIDTCDTTTGPSDDCSESVGRKFAARQGGTSTFDPADTDNDGLLDPWELLGVYKGCTQTPTAPFYDPGECTDITFFQNCTSCESFVSTPLSAFRVHPREWDALIHIDSHGVIGDHHHHLDYDQSELVKHIYREEGLECVSNETTTCADAAELADYNRIFIHLFPSETRFAEFLRPVGESYVRTFFNKHFPTYRKFTGTHRYALMVHGDGTGSADDSPGRYFVLLDQGGLAKGVIFAHEHGHLLGLKHGGFEGNDGCEDRNDKPNYPSLMNYAFSYYLPKKNQITNGLGWPSDIGEACTNNEDCTESGFCENAVCRIDTGSEYARFSRGLNNNLDETELTELFNNPRLAAELFAYKPDDLGTSNRYGACCETANGSCAETIVDCGADWNLSNTYQGGNVCANLNDFHSNSGCTPPGDADPDCEDSEPEGDVFSDNDDWRRMYSEGKLGLTKQYENTFVVLASHITQNGSTVRATDVSGWQNDGAVTGATSTTSVGTFGIAAGFDGPGGTNQLIEIDRIPATAAMGLTIDGFRPRGFRFDLYFLIDDMESGDGHQLIYSDLFRLEVENNSGDANGTLRLKWNDGTNWQTYSHTDPVMSDQWYRVTLGRRDWDDADNEIFLCLVPWIADAWDYDSGKCVGWDEQEEQNDVDIGGIVLGQRQGDDDWSLSGKLDEPFAWNWFNNKFFSLDDIPCPTEPCP